MRNLRNLLTATALTVAVFVQAQQLVPVGRGSYASYTPLANCRSTRHAVEWGNYKGGIDVQRPSYWIDNGTEMKWKTDSKHTGEEHRSTSRKGNGAVIYPRCYKF